MRTCVLAGGVGSARLLQGLVRVLPPGDVTVVVNTGDDERIRGLHVSPDVDTVLYHLADVTDRDRGWGMRGESFRADERYRELAEASGVAGVDLQEWFALGDRDLATHLLRTRLLETGRTLSEATDALRRGMGIGLAILPMSDDPVRTVLDTADGYSLAFQEYFVRRRHTDDVRAVRYEGAGTASAAPGVLDAISSAELIVVGPSNPILSVAPILSIGTIRDVLAARGSPCVAVSPIVGGRALKGPADRVLSSLGWEPSPAGVAEVYRGLIDVLVVDETDRDAARDRPGGAGVAMVVTDTIMTTPDAAARLCKEVIAHAL